MAEHFDPHHRWLAIPPQEQPPNHYRLLGLANFESDADVVEGAADRQMAHVRSHKTGKHAEHVDGVLNEIAAAKHVLLDVQKKVEYDAQLRMQSAKPAAKAPPVAQPLPPVVGAASLPPPVAPQFSSRAKPVARPAPSPSLQTQASSIAPLLLVLVGVAALGALLLVGGLGAFWWLRSSSSPVRVAVAQPHGSEESAVVESKPVVTESVIAPEEISQSPPTPDPQEEPPTPDPVAEPQSPVEEPVTEEPLVAEPEEESSEEAAPVGPPAHIAALFPELQPDARLPLPPADVSQQNAERIAQVFRVAEARTPEAKAELAQRMLKTGRETVDDAASQYELLNQSRLLAAGVGDMETALAAIGDLTERFQVGSDDLSAATISQLLAAPATNVRRKEIIDRGLVIVDTCLGRDHYVAAAGLIKDLLIAARRNRDLDQISALTARQKIGSELYTAHKTATPAIERLRAEPNNAAAALAAGKFFALVKGDWRVGLPLLAAGSDAELQRLAEVEMKVPTDAAAQRSLADGWYAVAGSGKGTEPDRERARARLWYDKAASRLSGLPKVEVEQRLEELAKVTLDGGAPYDASVAFAVALPPGASRKAEPKVRDLLEIIAQQPLDGQWQIDQQGRLMPIGRVPRMQIPVALPSEYLLEAVVVDLTPQQPGIPLSITLGQGTRAFQIDFDSRLSKREIYTGVQPVDGVQSSLNALAFRNQVMRADRPNLVRCLVGEKRLVVNVNGVDVIGFDGDMRRIGSEQRDVVASIFLHPNRSEWALASLKLVALSDDAPVSDEVAEVDEADLELGETNLTPANDPQEGPGDGKGEPINFGKRLDDNVIAGNWRGRGPQLHVAAFDGPALYQLPIKPAEEYHLQLDLTRRGKGSELAIGLVYQGVQCVVALDRDEQTSSAIVGHSPTGAGENDFVVSRAKEVLPAASRVKVDCVVSEDSFRVSIDGEPFLEFTGDANWDGPGATWQPRDKDVLFLGANSAEFDIHSVRLSTSTNRPSDVPNEDVGP